MYGRYNSLTLGCDFRNALCVSLPHHHPLWGKKSATVLLYNTTKQPPTPPFAVISSLIVHFSFFRIHSGCLISLSKLAQQQTPTNATLQPLVDSPFHLKSWTIGLSLSAVKKSKRISFPEGGRHIEDPQWSCQWWFPLLLLKPILTVRCARYRQPLVLLCDDGFTSIICAPLKRRNNNGSPLLCHQNYWKVQSFHVDAINNQEGRRNVSRSTRILS